MQSATFKCVQAMSSTQMYQMAAPVVPIEVAARRFMWGRYTREQVGMLHVAGVQLSG